MVRERALRWWRVARKRAEHDQRIEIALERADADAHAVIDHAHHGARQIPAGAMQQREKRARNFLEPRRQAIGEALGREEIGDWGGKVHGWSMRALGRGRIDFFARAFLLGIWRKMRG
jgi:vacuolar-type H+-ATPase subunit H